MFKIKGLVKSLTGWLGKAIAGPDTDPATFFFGNLAVLPNPDPILRAIGRADQVYASIMSDPHVLGELRIIWGAFRQHDYTVVVGDAKDPRSVQAKELCEAFLANCVPNEVAGDWLEIMWQMTMAMFYGYRAHEVVWEYNESDHPLLKGKYLPSLVVDVPGRRFHFDVYGKPLLISRGNWMGAHVEPYQILISRHMATMENPYGQAVASALFWVWTFKTGGWRFFVKYCERHGIPWPVARYGQGTTDDDIDKIEQALAAMLESAYAVVPSGTEVELLTPAAGGSVLPQERLIDRCNKEMSKALNGHAMISENGPNGSRAATESAADRQEDLNNADRDIAAATISRLFSFITAFNIGDDVAPPKLELFRHTNAGKDRVEVYDVARKAGARPSKKALLKETGIPEAEDDDDALLPDPPAAQPGTVSPSHLDLKKQVEQMAAAGRAKKKLPPPTVEFTAEQLEELEVWAFAKAAGMTEAEAMDLASQAADDAIEAHLVEPVYQMLVQYEREGKSLEQFRDDLADMVPGLDDDALREVLEQALTFGILRGAATNAA